MQKVHSGTRTDAIRSGARGTIRERGRAAANRLLTDSGLEGFWGRTKIMPEQDLSGHFNYELMWTLHATSLHLYIELGAEQGDAYLTGGKGEALVVGSGEVGATRGIWAREHAHVGGVFIEAKGVFGYLKYK